MEQQSFEAAASEYASEHIGKYGFPESPAVHRCEIELAFMSGAQWANTKQISRIKAELTQAKTELEVLTNARP